MSNINASEDNVEFPSTYGNSAYKDYRKTENKRKAAGLDGGREAELEEIRDDNIEAAKRQKSKIVIKERTPCTLK